MTNRTCAIEDCDNPSRARDMCRAHYQRWNRYGRIESVFGATVEDRFWSKVTESDTGCWLWTGGRNQFGYGQFSDGGKKCYAHRWAYEAMVAPIPDGLDMDHLCRTPSCVNPYHLDPVTTQVNIQRAVHNSNSNLRKTHCKRNHEFTPENTRTEKNGRRQCRECLKRRARERKARRAQTSAHPGWTD